MESQDSQSQEFEFSSSQNELVGDLAKKMSFVGMLMLVFGGLGALGGLLSAFNNPAEGISNIISGVVSIIVGIWTRNASLSFQQIVDTQGRDIENLMGALGQLRKLYALQYWAILIAIVFIVLALIVAVITGLVTAGQ